MWHFYGAVYGYLAFHIVPFSTKYPQLPVQQSHTAGVAGKQAVVQHTID